MKILWVMNKELDTASDRAYISELSQALSGFKQEMKIIARYKKQKTAYNADIEYVDTFPIRILKQTSYFLKLPHFLIKRIKQYKPAVIVADRPAMVYSFIPVIFWARRFEKNCKFILDVRSLPTNNTNWILKQFNLFFRYNLCLKIAASLFDGCMVITEAMKKQVLQTTSFSDKQMTTWSSAYAKDVFNPSKDKLRIKENDSYIILYHGTLAINRNLLELVEAMQYTPANFKLYILGDGPLLNELKSHTNAMKLQNKIQFFNSVPYDKVPQFIQKGDVGIIPLPDTPWFRVCMPIKLLEYMAMGLPIIAPKLEPFMEAYNNKADITLYSLKSEALPKEIANKIIETYNRFGNNFFSNTNANLVTSYTWEAQAKNIVHFFKTTLVS